MIPIEVNNMFTLQNSSDSSTSSQMKAIGGSLMKSVGFKKGQSKNNKKSIASSSKDKKSFYVESELHSICKSHPELADVEYILDTSSNAICKRDSMGKLPLHVACEKGASADVMEVLISEYESACMIADADGKLPIHHLCENYVRNSDPRLSQDEAEDDFLMILELMLQSSGNSLLKEDKNGLSPLEHAIEANLDYDLVYSLQKTTEKLMKARRSHGVRD